MHGHTYIIFVYRSHPQYPGKRWLFELQPTRSWFWFPSPATRQRTRFCAVWLLTLYPDKWRRKHPRPETLWYEKRGR